MSINQSLPIFFDSIGFLLSIGALVIVLNASTIRLGKIRQGFKMLSWGFITIALSFAWSVLFVRLALYPLMDLRPFLMAFGMAMFFISSYCLFSFEKKPMATV